MIRELFTALGQSATRPLRRVLVGMVIAAVLQGAVFALLVPVLREVLGGTHKGAWSAFGILACACEAFAVVFFRSEISGYTCGSMLSRGLHHRLGDHIASLPLGWFTAERVGQLGQLTSQGVVRVMTVPAHLLRPLVEAVVTPATVVALMFFFDVRLALAVLVCVPVLVGVYRWGGVAIGQADQARHHALDEASGRVIEYARAQPVLRAFGRTTEGYRLLDEALVGQRDAGRRVILAGLTALSGFAFAIQAVFTTVLVLGVYWSLGGALDVPTLLAMLVLAARFVEPLLTVASLGAAMRLARNALRQMNTLLATSPLPEPKCPRVPAGADVEFAGVSFGYDHATPVLREVSFHAPAGAVTALVGPSGSGKTTIARLVARFYDVDAGAVRVGGVDVREVDPAELISRVSVVFQDVYLFDATIEENVRLARPQASDAQLRAAACAARLDEVVARLPNGWATQVGEGGTALSGGERQRVSIARALLKDAPIVVLDEATAALDPENEAAISAALAVLATDRTVVVIAHRLSTVAAADQILVLADGGIVERGRHAELLEAGGRYAAFWAERTDAAGWRLPAASALRPA